MSKKEVTLDAIPDKAAIDHFEKMRKEDGKKLGNSEESIILMSEHGTFKYSSQDWVRQMRLGTTPGKVMVLKLKKQLVREMSRDQ